MSRSYRKNLLSFMAAALLPLVLMGWIISQFVFSYMTKELHRSNAGTLTQIVQTDGIVLNELEATFLSLSTNKALAFELAEILETGTADYHEALYYRTIKTFLSSKTYSSDYIQSIYIIMDHCPARIFSSTDGIVMTESFHDEEWINQVEFPEGQMNAVCGRTIPASGSAPSTNVISILRKFTYGTPNQTGTIVLNLNKQYWNKLLRNTDVRGSSEIIAEHNGEVLFESNGAIAQKWAPHLEELSQYEEDFFNYELDGETYIVSCSTVEQYNVRYYMFTKTSDLYQIPYTILKGIGVCAVLMFAITFFVLSYLSRRQYARVKHIINLLRAESSIMKIPFSEENYDEFEYIAHSIQDNYLLQKYFEAELKEKSYKQKYTELAALQAQINPHMLYNTLETIQWKAYSLTDGYNDVVMMLESLSSLLKYSLNPATEMVSLGEEIDHTVNYIRLVKLRYHDQFRVIWDYSEDIIDCASMRLILQPIIENAIHHGVRHSGSDTTSIIVHMECVNDMIRVRVMNTGVGMTPEQLKQVRSTLEREFAPAKGMGLYNINKRLQLQYGTQLHIHSSLYHGTIVSFQFPAKPYRSAFTGELPEQH